MKVIKRLAIIFVILITILAALYFALDFKVEAYVKNGINSLITRYFNYDVSFQKVNFNILTNTITIDSIEAKKIESNDKVTVDKIDIEINLSNILSNEVVFSSIVIESPTLYVDSTSKIDKSNGPPKALKNDYLSFYIAKLVVNKCQINYAMSDSSIVSPEFSFSLFNLSNNFTQNQTNGFEFNLQQDNGFSIQWIGSSKNLSNSTGIFKASGIKIQNLPKVIDILKYLPLKVKFDTAKLEMDFPYELEGFAEVSTVYEVSAKDSLIIDLRKTRLEVSGLKIRKDSVNIEVHKAVFDDIDFDFNTKILSIPTVIFNTCNVGLELGDNILDRSKELKKLGFIKEIYGWKLDVPKVRVRKLVVTTDNFFAKEIHFSQLDLELGDDITYKTFGKLNDIGVFEVSSKITKDHNYFDIEFFQLPLTNYLVDSIMTKYSALDIRRGYISGNLRTHFSDEDFSLGSLFFKGDYTLDTLVVYQDEDPLFESAKVTLKNVRLKEGVFTVKKIELDELFSVITINKRPKTLYDVVKLKKSFMHDFNDVKTFSIDSLTFEKATLLIEDPTFFNIDRVLLKHVKGSVIDIRKDNASLMRLRGRYDDNTTLQIYGKASILSDIAKLNFEIYMYNLELSSFQRNLFVFGGHEILKGHVDMTVYYSPNRDGTMGRKIDVDITKLNVGEKLYESNNRLPISLGSSMLSDKHGNLDINFKIKNSIEKTDLKSSDYAFKAISNSVAKAVSKPFSAIASLFKKKNKPITLTFVTNSAELTQNTKNRLKSLAQTMKKDDKIVLEILGIVDAQREKLINPAEYIQEQVKAIETYAYLPQINATGNAVDDFLLQNSDSFIEFYFMVTKSRIPSGKSSDVIALKKYYNKLLHSEKLKAFYQRNLSVNRAKKVKKYLTSNYRIPVNRLYIKAMGKEAEKNRNAVIITLEKR